jgi:hypothetical protein
VSGAPPRPTGAKFSPESVTSAPPGEPATRGLAARGAGGREASYCVTACEALTVRVRVRARVRVRVRG